jgi:hypothetical protein
MQEITELSQIPAKAHIYFWAEWVQDSVDLLENLKSEKIYSVNLESGEEIADHF